MSANLSNKSIRLGTLQQCQMLHFEATVDFSITSRERLAVVRIIGILNSDY